MDDELRPEATPEAASVVPTFSAQTLTIASLLVAILGVAIVILFTQRKLKSRGNALILAGTPDAGKTAILSSLVYNQTLPTHTSLQANSAVFTHPNLKAPLRVVDIPGHPRIRDQFREHLAEAKAIAFVVDASTVSRNGAAVAEHLHSVLHALTSLPPSQTPPSLLILAHKADLLKTTGSSTGAAADTLAITRVKTVLERELEKRRASQSGGHGIEGLGAEDEASELGGLECGGTSAAFKFDSWDGGEVSFIGTSVKVVKVAEIEKGGDTGLTSLLEWIENNF